MPNKFSISYGIRHAKSNVHVHSFQPLDPAPNYLSMKLTHP